MNSSSNCSTLASIKVENDYVNFENKRLASVQRGIFKSDVITKAQLDEIHIFVLGKVKTHTRDIAELKNKIEKLSTRISTPNLAAAATTSAVPSAEGKKRLAPTPKQS